MLVDSNIMDNQQANSGLWGGIAGGLGSMAGGYFTGPAGAVAGSEGAKALF